MPRYLGGMTVNDLREKLAATWRHFGERARRLVAAGEARQLGYGGITRVSRACGLSRVTLTKAVAELTREPVPAGRARREGAGRPRVVELDPAVLPALEALIEPLTRGDTESPLRWTCKSTRALATALTQQ